MSYCLVFVIQTTKIKTYDWIDYSSELKFPTFCSIGLDSRLHHRYVLEMFPRSQHRPSLITPPGLALFVSESPVGRWNFRKVNWSHYISLISKLARRLPSPDSPDVNQAYQDFCTDTENFIPRGLRKNYTTYWDAVCETLCQDFLQSLDDNQYSRAATILLIRLDKKRKICGSEAIQSIGFLNSRKKAWSIVNNLTTRLQHSLHLCPFQSNVIAEVLKTQRGHKELLSDLFALFPP